MKWLLILAAAAAIAAAYAALRWTLRRETGRRLVFVSENQVPGARSAPQADGSKAMYLLDASPLDLADVESARAIHARRTSPFGEYKDHYVSAVLTPDGWNRFASQPRFEPQSLVALVVDGRIEIVSALSPVEQQDAEKREIHFAPGLEEAADRFARLLSERPPR